MAETTFIDNFRRGVRIIFLALWSLLSALIATPSMCLCFGACRCRLGSFWSRLWSTGARVILGMRLNICGKIPRKHGFLVVSNHLGYLDVLAHASALPLRFAPKAEIRKWPFFNWLTSLSAPIWIDRKNPRMAAVYAKEFRNTMDNGISMLVYPEGTSTDGLHGVLPFKSTAFAAALDANAEILPTLLFYRQTPAEPLAAWHDDTPFGTHVWQTLALKNIVIDLYILPPVTVNAGESRKDLAIRIHQLMEKEYWEIAKRKK